jgi:hypothetical protein
MASCLKPAQTQQRRPGKIMNRSGPGMVSNAGLTTPGGQNTPAPAATTNTGQD